MNVLTNELSIRICTVNGSGSQSANQILAKSLFRMGLPTSAKNIFPSNIAGLPTWFIIRASAQGFLSFPQSFDLQVFMNSQTLKEDFEANHSSSLCLANADLKKVVPEALVPAIHWLPCRDLVKELSSSPQIKKLLINLVYVGALSSILRIPKNIVLQAISDQFKGKEALVEPNQKAFLAGFEFFESQKIKSPFQTQEISEGNKGYLFCDGNSAAALGWISGGCTYASWYPITPSTSLVEAFEKNLPQLRENVEEDKQAFAVIQAEDELSAISMAVGAGWAGARAATATSGPGLSLMAEAIGLSYYTEVPVVVWDIQRTGPSTGLPTRTMQGDLLSAVSLSHGDTQHIVLMPSSVEDCFEFGWKAFDIADQLQGPVLVLSDLDLGMNLSRTKKFELPQTPWNRGKVLNESELKKIKSFDRYGDPDGDGIPYRTLPGTRDSKAAYFTRGSGHNEKAQYSEKTEDYQTNMNRIKKKYVTLRNDLPPPLVSGKKSQFGLICYGSSAACLEEVSFLLSNEGIQFDSLILRSLPVSDGVIDFIDSHSHTIVLEQNRDGQLHMILKSEVKSLEPSRFHSLLHWTGLPIEAKAVAKELTQLIRGIES